MKGEKLKGNIKCYSCGWTKKNALIKKWFNVKCPKCKDNFILDKADMKIAEKLQRELESEYITQNKNKISKALFSISFHFDTANLR